MNRLLHKEKYRSRVYPELQRRAFTQDDREPTQDDREPAQDDRGQALTEFVIIFAVFLFLILMHFQLSMNYVASSVMNYASYMAARTNLVSDEFQAEYVAKSIVGTPGDSAFGPFAQVNDIRVDGTGVNIEYTSPLYVPIIRLPFGSSMKFNATSRMGKEPKDCSGVEEDNGC
ncbi:MAG: pilus assembly protein [Deltaproteobacteria bacterium]|nr:pilus assembly protein [Deltaproteobacteria bacterium]